MKNSLLAAKLGPLAQKETGKKYLISHQNGKTILATAKNKSDVYSFAKKEGRKVNFV